MFLWPYFPQFRFFAPFLISHFPLYLCGSLYCVFFAFLMLIFFNLFNTSASFFLSSSINQSCSCFFFENKNKNFVLLFLAAFSRTFDFCTGIYSAEFVLFSLGPFLSWYFSWLGVGGDSALAAAVHWVLGRISRPR